MPRGLDQRAPVRHPRRIRIPVAVILALIASPAAAEVLVVDGDTLKFDGTSYRIEDKDYGQIRATERSNLVRDC